MSLLIDYHSAVMLTPLLSKPDSLLRDSLEIKHTQMELISRVTFAFRCTGCQVNVMHVLVHRQKDAPELETVQLEAKSRSSSELVPESG